MNEEIAASAAGLGGGCAEAARRRAPQPIRRDWFALLTRGASAVAILASGVLYATLPPSPDQWFLGYTGWRLVEGAVPYSGFADGNWPGCHWLHAASVLLLGNTPYTWRVFDFLLMMGCVLFAAATVRSLWGPRAGRWMLVLYPALYVVLGRWFAGERDIVGAHLLFVALWFYWRGLSGGRPWWQIGTGLFIGLSALVKPTFSLFGAFLALHCLLAVSSAMRRVRERMVQLGVAGMAAVCGLLAGFGLLRLEGTELASFWELAVQSVVVRYGSDSATAATFLTMFAQNFARSWHWISAGALLGLAANLLRRESNSAAKNLLFPTLWVTGIATYLLQAQALGYTLGVAYAATVPILCSGLGLLSFAHGPFGRRAVLVGALAAVPILGTAKKWTSEFPSSVAWLSGRIDAPTHYSAFGAGDGMSTAQAMALAAELQRAVPENGTILVWGRANVINFLARRPQPTRFHHNVTIMRRYLPARLATKWNTWFSEEVAAHAPEACVVNEGELDDTPPAPTSITFLKRYLAENYRRVRSVGDAGLYLRK